jgi:hypothetical protein
MQAPPNEKWIRALRRLQRVKCCPDLQSYLHLDEKERSVYPFLDRVGRFIICGINFTAALQFTAAILYDQECSGSARNLEEPCVDVEEESKFRSLFKQSRYCGWYMHHITTQIFEHMLLIDYGIDQADDIRLEINFNCPEWPRARREFDKLCSALTEWAQFFPARFCHYLPTCLYRLNYGLGFDKSDLAIMLYYYDAHRKPVSPADYSNGMTGYFGVLQELISEVPVRGTDRLQRKLSVDVNELIPKTVKDPVKRQKMISIARNIATQHNLPLCGTISHVDKPLFETIYKDGFRKRNWGARFKAFFSSLLNNNSRSQDEESKALISKELLVILE